MFQHLFYPLVKGFSSWCDEVLQEKSESAVGYLISNPFCRGCSICNIREAKDTIPDAKMPHAPICLITSAGGELPVDFTVLQHCLRLSLTQPSKIKQAHELFLINEEELKGKGQFSFSITFILSL